MIELINASAEKIPLADRSAHETNKVDPGVARVILSEFQRATDRDEKRLIMALNPDVFDAL